MNEKSNYGLWFVALAALILSGLCVITGFTGGEKPLIGGLVHNTQETFDAGVAVKGTEVVSSGLKVTAKDLDVINGSTTSTAQVGSSAIGTKKGVLCLWNGTNYTLVKFAANAVATTAIATSTSCP